MDTKIRCNTIEMEKNLVSTWVVPHIIVVWTALHAKYSGIPGTPLSKSEKAKLPRMKFATVRRDFTPIIRRNTSVLQTTIAIAKTRGKMSYLGLNPKISSFSSSSDASVGVIFWFLFVVLFIFKYFLKTFGNHIDYHGPLLKAEKGEKLIWIQWPHTTI